MRQRITKCLVDSLKPGERDVFVWDSDLTGFGLKVTPAGRKVYLLQYRTRKQNWKTAPKRVTLGKHGVLTAERARKLAADFLLEVKSGGDPTVAWATSELPTVADLARRFLIEYLPNKKRPPRESTINYYESLLRCHVIPGLGEKGVDEGAPHPTWRIGPCPFFSTHSIRLSGGAGDRSTPIRQDTSSATAKSAAVPGKRSCSLPSKCAISLMRSTPRRMPGQMRRLAQQSALPSGRAGGLVRCCGLNG